MRLRRRAVACRDLRGLAAPASGSRSWTAWARPRPCSWCSRTGRARAAPGRRECPCRVPRRSCATPAACGRRRRAGRALGQDAVGGDGLLQAPRPVAADLRRRVAPHRRRVSPRRRRLLRALRPRGRWLQGRRPVGDAGRARVGGAPAPRRAGRGRRRGGGCGRPRQALRLRGAADPGSAPRRARGAACAVSWRRASPGTSGRAGSSSWTICRARRPASSSASACAIRPRNQERSSP